MRPNCLTRDIFLNEVLGCLSHVNDQLLSLNSAQFVEALQAIGIILDLLLEYLAHLHAQLIRVQGCGFGPPSFELDMLVVVLASPPESVSNRPRVADELRMFLGRSYLVAARPDLDCEPKLALISISDVHPGVSDQLLHFWYLPRLG